MTARQLDRAPYMCASANSSSTKRMRSLLRGGSAIALSPTPFGLLCALARHPGALLTKHALLDEVWGHRFVSDSVLKGPSAMSGRFSATILSTRAS